MLMFLSNIEINISNSIFFCKQQYFFWFIIQTFYYKEILFDLCSWWRAAMVVVIYRYRVHSHDPFIRSHRGTKVVWPDFQPMRVPEEPVWIDLFRQNQVFTSLHLKSPVHDVQPQAYILTTCELIACKRCIIYRGSCRRLKNTRKAC